MKLKELKIRKSTVIDSFPKTIHPLLRKIYLNRGVGNIEDLDLSTKFLLSYNKIQGIESAVKLLSEAVFHDIFIMVVGDFDADGATSIALTVLALKSMGMKKIKYFVPNRFKDGYGLNADVVHKMYLDGVKIILTVDNGIASYDGVTQAHKYGIIVIITDHHLPKNKLPKADAIVNPNINKNYSLYSSLAGVGVAFYLMLALRSNLRQKGWFRNNKIEPNLTELLDLVALGTIIDVVPLDRNNRILVRQGINRIRVGKCRPGIIALLEIANFDKKKLVCKDVSFIIGPRLNAAGRIDDMSICVSLLLTNDINKAKLIAKKLDILNNKRKYIEKNMQNDALKLCQKLKNQYQNNLPMGLTLYSSTWHQGITGILASKLKDNLNRPVIIFALSKNGILKGSGRSIPNLHLLKLLEHIDLMYPSLMITFGGHAMAIGISLLNEIKYKKFSECFSNLVNNYINQKKIENIIWSDGELKPLEFNLYIAELLRESSPWGQSFPEPTFNGRFKLKEQYIIANKHLKVVVIPINGTKPINGILFNVDMKFWPNTKIYIIDMVFKLDINEFYGKKIIQLLIEYIWPFKNIQ